MSLMIPSTVASIARKAAAFTGIPDTPPPDTTLVIVISWIPAKVLLSSSAASLRLVKASLAIVRSSSAHEDKNDTSNAGHFLTVGNVPSKDNNLLQKAIYDVFASYGESIKENEQIFIQPHLEDIKISGVLFTKEIDCKSEYYVINYDENTDVYDSITSGKSISAKTYIRYKKSPNKNIPTFIQKLIDMATELEGLFGMDDLDIEFAVNKDDQVFVFQVRPLLGRITNQNVPDEYLLLKIVKKLEKLNAPHPNLYGNKTVYGVMPDWNPAEIIGIRPKNLALSIYKELITDAIWAYQRDKYGYKNLRSFPLMVSFLGLPYIDVRVSFNSFLPQTLGNDLSDKLVNYYLDKLIKSPNHHDKVEFNIIYSCYYFDIEKRIVDLRNHDFSVAQTEELKEALKTITFNIISKENGLMVADLLKVKELDTRKEKILASQMSTIDKIYWLAEECKRYGTLPFAGLARAAFVAVQMLHSLQRLQVLSSDDINVFLQSLNTVAKEFNFDYWKLVNNEITQNDFLINYGHLRPGTYDILSDNYREGFPKYFKRKPISGSKKEVIFQLTKSQESAIQELLTKSGFNLTVSEIFKFFRDAIEGRERAKFIFTKCIDEILEKIKLLGKRFKIEKKELAHLDIDIILKLYASLESDDVDKVMLDNIDKNKKQYKITKSIKLPHLITDPSEVYDFYLEEAEPNFITLNSITAEVVLEKDFNDHSLKDKIAFIKNADPGYDWLFSNGIKGLITMYGGANSHMAIRAAESGLPAVIGAGEKLFNIWKNSNVIELNCSTKQVKIVL